MPWAIFGHASRLQFDAALKAQFRKIARCMHDQWPVAWSSGRVLRSKCCLQLNIELTHRAVVGSDENNWAVSYLSIFSLSYHLDADTHQLIFGHLSIVTHFNKYPWHYQQLLKSSLRISKVDQSVSQDINNWLSVWSCRFIWGANSILGTDLYGAPHVTVFLNTKKYNAVTSLIVTYVFIIMYWISRGSIIDV